MATLTAHGTHGLVELCLEVDSEQSRPGWLVLRGLGLLDRRALATGKRAQASTRRSGWSWHSTPDEWKPPPTPGGIKEMATNGRA